MTVYIDELGHCHTENADGRQAVEDEFFDGRAPEAIEGYMCTLGVSGERMIAPWQPWEQLDTAQREYEREQLAAAQAALAESLTAEEIAAAIEEGVNSI